MKKYIQIGSFNAVSFSPIFTLMCFLPGPEKDGVRMDGLDGLRFLISPQISSYTCSDMQEKGISEKP